MIPLALFRTEGDIDDECDALQGCSKYICIFPSRETYLRDSDQVLLIGHQMKAEMSVSKTPQISKEKKPNLDGPNRRKARSSSPKKRSKNNEHVIDLDIYQK
jgi:hypothetical protein